ncbi:GbsR/MarR family transcriptional regulator [Homoserinibacter gongjuensis]|uniref:Transcriptional regulator n=1 Tax=Homoserinibacter gongjuensis TaxID=1162968 RepID=A0ABQ6K2F8_9MICO|nr:hypothetical protein [Homoserinibacter gongjuensis]GMA93092.1 hypothetical protein GCM10025869_36210 [Homoserinibacter gongjuensis]
MSGGGAVSQGGAESRGGATGRRDPERREAGRDSDAREGAPRDTERRSEQREVERDPERREVAGRDPDERDADERDERQQFIDALGDVLASWNLPRSTGRVYGALLLHAEPVTFDHLRAELQLSAGAVSTGVRELVSWGLARTIPQAGSRRLLVEAAGGFEQLLAASHERTRTFIRVLDAGAALVDGPRAGERLADVTALFEGYVDAGERMLRARARAARGSR